MFAVLSEIRGKGSLKVIFRSLAVIRASGVNMDEGKKNTLPVDWTRGESSRAGGPADQL